MDFTIEMKVSIDDAEAHLMHFIPEKLHNALSGTKVKINNLVVTKESEQQD